MSTAIAETYREDPQVLEVVGKANNLVESAMALEITDGATDAQAKAALAVVTTQAREFEKLRKTFVQPLNEHVRAINLFFKDQSTPLNQAEAILKQKVGAYFSEQQEIARKERIRLEKLAAKRQERADTRAQDKGQIAAPPVPVATVAAPTKTTKTEAGSVTMRTVRKWEIVDESELPRELMMPNDKKIKAMVEAKIAVAGVRVFEEQVPVVRGRS